MSPGHEFPHHQVGSPRGASLNLAERRRATEDLTERKEVLGEGKSIAGEGSRPVEESRGRSGESTVMTNEEDDFRSSHFLGLYTGPNGPVFFLPGTNRALGSSASSCLIRINIL